MKRIAVVLLLGVFAIAANGQEAQKKAPPSPEEIKQMMESSMGMMVPMMAKMSEAMIEAQLSAAEKPDTARRIAQFKKNLYEELQKQGFSKSQAFSIVQSTALPSASPGQR